MGVTVPHNRLPTRLVMFHGLGAVAYGVKDSGFSVFLLLFYNQVLGIDAGLVSLALALALVLDGLLDPAIGYLSDHTRSRWGRRLPWLYLSALPLGVIWALLWMPTPDNPPGFIGLVLLAMLVRMAVSCCEVPSIALVPELTRDYDERSRLVRYRFLFSWIGGLIMAALAYGVFLRDGLLQPEGYRQFGIAGGALIVLSVLVSAYGQHKTAAAIRPAAPTTRPTPREAIREITQTFAFPALRVAIGAEICAFASQGLGFALANYMYLYVWRFTPLAYTLYPLPLFFSVLVACLIVSALHRRIGKRATAARCILLAIPPLALPFLLHALGFWPEPGSVASTALVFVSLFFANSLSVTAIISIVSMIADVVEAAEEKTGQRSEGTLYSGHLFAQKCATGIGILTAGLMLDWAGLPDHARPDSVPAHVADRIAWGYVGMVCIFWGLTALILRYFPIERADHERRLALLSKGANPA